MMSNLFSNLLSPMLAFTGSGLRFLSQRTAASRSSSLHRCLLLTVLVVNLFHASELGAQQTEDAALTPKIAAYIRGLDSAQFLEREESLQKLSSLGTAAIRPLSVQIIAGSPESAWRSKQALESIGIRGDEETFLKTVCVLKLLFVGASESLNQRIAELEIQWKLEQKRNIISLLRSKGARVTDGSERALEGHEGLLLWNGVLEPETGQDSQAEIRNRVPAFQASAQRPTLESLREVDLILESSVEENRNRLFGTATPQGNSVASSMEVDSEILLELQLQRRFGVPMRGQIIGRNRNFPTEGISVLLDHQWQGTADDLQQLKGLRELKRVELDQVDLPLEQIRVLAETASLISVHIVGDQLATEKIQSLSSLEKLQDIEFTDRTLRTGDLKPLGKLTELMGVTLCRVTLSPEMIEELQGCQRLTSLALIEMKIGPDVLESIAKLSNLRLLNLELCKFKIKAYRALKQARPELEVGFTPQALLGVRGPMDPSNEGCEISQVVPNSGAELGGLKAGDVVVRINGQPVEAFEDLRLHVAQHQAGDVLSVIVNRTGQEVELKIQLTPFEPLD